MKPITIDATGDALKRVSAVGDDTRSRKFKTM